MSSSEGFYASDPEAQAQCLRRLAEAALPRWGLAPREMSLIKYRENAVFRVDTTAGSRVALRIHRHGYHSDAAL
ncbi:MAG: aminoglycoside phosphotransferase, partial [Gammaproteobacteria bacterium]